MNKPQQKAKNSATKSRVFNVKAVSVFACSTSSKPTSDQNPRLGGRSISPAMSVFENVYTVLTCALTKPKTPSRVGRGL